MKYLQASISRMPINLLLLEDGTLVFTIVAPFKTIFDHYQGEIKAEFSMQDFKIEGTKFTYDFPYNYKNIPEMLGWLKQQNLKIQ